MRTAIKIQNFIHDFLKENPNLILTESVAKNQKPETIELYLPSFLYRQIQILLYEEVKEENRLMNYNITLNPLKIHVGFFDIEIKEKV